MPKSSEHVHDFTGQAGEETRRNRRIEKCSLACDSKMLQEDKCAVINISPSHSNCNTYKILQVIKALEALDAQGSVSLMQQPRKFHLQ